QRARRRGWALEEPALEWLLRRVGRDLGGLTALLDRLDRASLAAQRRITVPFLRQVLGAWEGSGSPATAPAPVDQRVRASPSRTASRPARRWGVPTSVQRPMWCSPLTALRAIAARSSGASLNRGGSRSAPSAVPITSRQRSNRDAR